jgi:hypothetical protein
MIFIPIPPDGIIQCGFLSPTAIAFIRSCMLLRKRQRFGTGLTAVLASIAMLVFAFVPAGTHALSLHSPAFAVTADRHSHDHGNHSHDDDPELAIDSSDASDHHHADHTHEKAGLVAVAGDVLRNALQTDYPLVEYKFDGGPPHGIDRPPRSVTTV